MLERDIATLGEPFLDSLQPPLFALDQIAYGRLAGVRPRVPLFTTAGGTSAIAADTASSACCGFPSAKMTFRSSG